MTKATGGGSSGADSKNTLYCSFCGKSQHEVRKLIAGPTVFICDECVELCMDIIREENKSTFVKDGDGRRASGRGKGMIERVRASNENAPKHVGC